MNDNGTYFKASNGWEYRVSQEGFMEYKFEESTVWTHLGTQVGLGLIEWAQSDIWTEES